MVIIIFFLFPVHQIEISQVLCCFLAYIGIIGLTPLTLDQRSGQFYVDVLSFGHLVLHACFFSLEEAILLYYPAIYLVFRHVTLV